MHSRTNPQVKHVVLWFVQSELQFAFNTGQSTSKLILLAIRKLGIYVKVKVVVKVLKQFVNKCIQRMTFQKRTYHH